MNIPKDKGKRKRKEKLKEKECLFPLDKTAVCGKIFYGTAKSLYCVEHRDRKYRNHIDKIRKNKNTDGVKADSNNQIIKHNLSDSTNAVYTCDLEGCEETFMINLSPKIKLYPRFCDTHRNAYKRQRFLELNKDSNGKVKV